MGEAATIHARARVVVSALGALTHELVLQEADPDAQKRLRYEVFEMCLGRLQMEE